MVIKKPIFFIGMGRSGTTIIFEAFSCHDDLGWLSNYSRRFSALPQVTLVHRLFFGARGQKKQGQRVSLVNKLLPKPQEAYSVWERLVGSKFRFTFLRDVKPTASEIERTLRYVSKVLESEGKSRFCAKFTGPPRIRFLTEVFHDAIFIDVIRDPRAVIASLLSVDFWKKKDGLNKPVWKGALNDEAIAIWEETGRSPVALAALQWCAVYEATEEEKEKIDGRYLRVFYEQFIDNHFVTMNKILSFCGLGQSRKINDYINSQQYKNMNYKFREELSREDILMIERIAGKQMQILGYI